MIDLDTYFKGRDKTHADELTPDILGNAEIIVARVNELLARAGRSDIHEINSGWRPAAINDATSNAAANSKHLTAEAIDIPDPDRTLATWVADNLDVLEEIGLWCEDFRWTPSWVHFQIVPPKSGKRIYIPSLAKPKDPDFQVTWA